MNRSEITKFLLIYSVSFTIIFLLWCDPFLFGGYSPLVLNDALSQHYPALVYIGEYFKKFILSLWAGTPALPLYDFSIGMGDDIMVTLLMHSANADIGNLLFALIPASHSIVAYVVLIIFRLYVAGLTFSYFGFSVLKADKRFVLIGALIYTFCNWTLIYAFLHISFLLALIYLPLIIAGFDAVLKNKKPYLFIVSVFLMALASFYFLYMHTIFLIFYAFIRIHMLYKEHYFKRLIYYGVKSIGFYITGIMMAAITFIPLLMAHLTSGRAPHVNVESLWHFSFWEYLNFIATFHSIEFNNNAQIQQTGLLAIAPAVIVLLLVNEQVKYRRHLISVVVLVLLFMLIPFGSFLLNGFGYVTDRCGFLFSFALVSVTLLTLPQVINPKTGKQYKRNAAALVGYACVLLTAIFINPNKSIYFFIGFGFVSLYIVILLLPIGSQKLRFFKKENVKINVIICLIIINTAFNANNFGINQFVVDGNIHANLKNAINASYFTKDDSFYREHNRTLSSIFYMKNLSMLNDYYGTTAYWSLVNPAFQDFSVKLENAQQRLMEWSIDGFDDRTVLNAVSVVKYYITDDENIPFGYVPYVELGGAWTLYENTFALPLGFTYTKTISADAYNKLDALDKQAVLLQAAVLTGENASPGDASLPGMLNKIQIPYTVARQEGLTWADGVLTITETNGATMTIEFRGLPNSETYIRLTGTDDARLDAINFVVIESENITKSLYFDIIDYSIRNDAYLINLGYSEGGKSSADFTFYLIENYTISDIEVYCIPMDNYPAWIEALREDVLEDIVIDTNKVTGDITLDDKKVLVLSIPYSKGWSCKVNGEERMLHKANHMFMGLTLDAGYNSIELTYCTPGLLSGVMVSLAGGLVFIGIFAFYKRKG